MSSPLPRLRGDLDFIPSPVKDSPGLLIRDSFRYSDSVLIVPPPLVQCLACFDGRQTGLDLRAMLVEISGQLQVGDLGDQLIDVLTRSGFLEDETFRVMKERREREFSAALVRQPSHAGSGYPEEPDALRETMRHWMGEETSVADANQDSLIGIAAPHVSPGGGYESYRAAYRLLGSRYKDRTFVILGTSHYGAPERFGLTRKPYVTPWGQSRTNVALVDELIRQAPESITTEDYCHAVEHSIEFQVLFLQYLYGPGIRILPILCGSFARSIYQGGRPEGNENVQRFFDSLGNISAREGNKLLWVLGVDMAHMGRRYGDQMIARAEQGEMAAVAERDKSRIERMTEADASGFWEQIQQNQDDLKWCGSAPIYTFLKAVPGARGTLRRYQQWNIDEQSVVSFAAVGFRR